MHAPDVPLPHLTKRGFWVVTTAMPAERYRYGCDCQGEHGRRFGDQRHACVGPNPQRGAAVAADRGHARHPRNRSDGLVEINAISSDGEGASPRS